jgi:hypothetical protein
MINRFLFLFLFLPIYFVNAQTEYQTKTFIECHLSEINAFTQIRNEDILQNNRLKATATILVTYDDNVLADVKTAVDYAKSIWEKRLEASQPIRIKVMWQALTGGTLAQTGISLVYRDFQYVPKKNTWYPVALAKNIWGKDLNINDFDITITINSGVNWYLGTDTKIAEGKYDLATVILHEIAHGLGFLSSFETTEHSKIAQYGSSNYPFVFDSFLQNTNKQRLTDLTFFSNPSTQLKEAVTNNGLYFGLSNITLDLPKLYAPVVYKDGSSIAHFDEISYPSGSANSLMSPNIKAAEANHSLGTLLLYCLSEMGWRINGLNGYFVTANENESHQNFMVYPNPVSDVLNVAIPEENLNKNISFEMIDLNGKSLMKTEKKNIQESSIQLNLNGFAEGMYFLNILDNQKKTVKKLIKQSQ